MARKKRAPKNMLEESGLTGNFTISSCAVRKNEVRGQVLYYDISEQQKARESLRAFFVRYPQKAGVTKGREIRS